MTDLVATERAFLGGLMKEADAYWRLAETVSPEMLTVPLHVDVYRAMARLAERNAPITVSALVPYLPAEIPDHGPTVALLATIRANAAQIGPADLYAEVITERYAARQIIDLHKWLAAQQTKGATSVELAEGVTARLRDIMEAQEPAKPVSIGSYASEVMDQAAQAFEAGDPGGLTTGLHALDDIMGRMRGGDLIVLMASQSEGKSALAAQIAAHVAARHGPVTYFQFEMSGADMAAREISAVAPVSVGALRDGRFDMFGWDAIRDAANAMEGTPFDIVDTDTMTVDQIATMCRRQQRQRGLSLVVIDQLDKIKPAGRHRDRFERFAEITASLKGMAKTLGVPVLVLAQRTRGAQRRDDPTPQILDADAPSIERDADIVVALWQLVNHLRQNKPAAREGEEAMTKWEMETHKAKGRAEVITLKSRRGERFNTARLRWNGAQMRFVDDGGQLDADAF